MLRLLAKPTIGREAVRKWRCENFSAPVDLPIVVPHCRAFVDRSATGALAETLAGRLSGENAPNESLVKAGERARIRIGIRAAWSGRSDATENTKSGDDENQGLFAAPLFYSLIRLERRT
jgi:hypothetical protein